MPFVDSSLLDLASPLTAAPGTLLIRPTRYTSGIGFTAAPPPAGNASGAHVLRFDGDRTRGQDYALTEGVDDGLWLATSDWRIEIDPDSAFSSFNDMPRAGDCFGYKGEFGLVGRYRYGEAYVTKAGMTIFQPEWNDFVGFRKWRIVVDIDDSGDPWVIAEGERD